MESFASLVANIIRTKVRFSFSKKKFLIFFSKTILISSILYISDIFDNQSAPWNKNTDQESQTDKLTKLRFDEKNLKKMAAAAISSNAGGTVDHDSKCDVPSFGMQKGGRIQPGQIFWQGKYINQAQFYQVRILPLIDDKVHR